MKKARRRDWPVYIIDFISFFFEDVRERHATEILEIKEYIYDAREIKIEIYA